MKLEHCSRERERRRDRKWNESCDLISSPPGLLVSVWLLQLCIMSWHLGSTVIWSLLLPHVSCPCRVNCWGCWGKRFIFRGRCDCGIVFWISILEVYVDVFVNLVDVLFAVVVFFFSKPSWQWMNDTIWKYLPCLHLSLAVKLTTDF